MTPKDLRSVSPQSRFLEPRVYSQNSAAGNRHQQAGTCLGGGRASATGSWNCGGPLCVAPHLSDASRALPTLVPNEARLKSAGRVAGVNDPLLTTRQVADYLGFSPETVLRRYRAGELVGIRLAANVLRCRESAVEAFLEQRAAGRA
jgi:excisionase family DNA binding protein